MCTQGTQCLCQTPHQVPQASLSLSLPHLNHMHVWGTLVSPHADETFCPVSAQPKSLQSMQACLGKSRVWQHIHASPTLSVDPVPRLQTPATQEWGWAGSPSCILSLEV